MDSSAFLLIVLVGSTGMLRQGQHQVIGSSRVVLAKVGEDVILPCHIEPPVDMEKQTVDWTRVTRPDLEPEYVHLRPDGRYKPQYTNPLYKQRTSLFEEELSHGNISLKLVRARRSDEGIYKCYASAINHPFLPSSIEIQLRVAEDVIYIRSQEVLRLLPDTSSVTKPITGILWKHGPDKAVEWDPGFGPDVEYYRRFKNGTELDKETGQLVIKNMTIEDCGEYSVHINGRLLTKTYTVKQMRKVPKPVVATKDPCDSNSTSCEVDCIWDVKESGSVTYRWKKDEGDWMESDSGPNSNRLIVTKDEDGKVKTLTCEVKNELGSERSDPEPNWLHHEGQHQVIGSSRVVLAKVGEDVILPCHIEPPVDMEKQTVDWTRVTRPDLEPEYVHLRPDGRYKPQYTNPLYKQRTSLFEEELSHGNISLKLVRARRSDEGIYKCYASAINHPFLPSSIEIQLCVAEDVIYIRSQEVLRLLPDTSSVTKPITGILWKHGPDKAVEWDPGFGPDVEYYRRFKNGTELDKETGQLVIKNMTIEDCGEYSVHINGRLLTKTYTVKQMRKVPKPVVATTDPCDSNSNSCEVDCIWDVKESGSVTYRWKKDEGDWMESDSGPNSNRLIVTKDEDGKVKTLTCEVKNELGSERSDPEPNWLHHEEKKQDGHHGVK